MSCGSWRDGSRSLVVRGAHDDPKALVAFIKADSHGYAQTFGLHIQQCVEQLRQFSESGRNVTEDKRDTYRELIVGNYGWCIEWIGTP